MLWTQRTSSEDRWLVRPHIRVQAGEGDHTMSCGVLGLPTPLFYRISSHVWPKSLADRALS